MGPGCAVQYNYESVCLASCTARPWLCFILWSVGHDGSGVSLGRPLIYGPIRWPPVLPQPQDVAPPLQQRYAVLCRMAHAALLFYCLACSQSQPELLRLLTHVSSLTRWKICVAGSSCGPCLTHDILYVLSLRPSPFCKQTHGGTIHTLSMHRRTLFWQRALTCAGIGISHSLRGQAKLTRSSPRHSEKPFISGLTPSVVLLLPEAMQTFPWYPAPDHMSSTSLSVGNIINSPCVLFAATCNLTGGPPALWDRDDMDGHHAPVLACHEELHVRNGTRTRHSSTWNNMCPATTVASSMSPSF